MPTFYGPRKTTKASWTQEDLNKALKAIQNQNISIRQAAKNNNIPEKTLRNRIKTGNFVKGTMGKKCHLGEEIEKQLVEHIKKLQSRGFALSRKNLRKIAFNLSQKMNLKQVFNSEKQIAGKDWYKSFMRRNDTLSLRKARGVSNARAIAMNKEETDNYFKLLYQCLNDYKLVNKPSNIYNMDETGLQLNNEPGLVVAACKGSKIVQVRQSSERGETITVVACCNAEGSFLPPYCIFKGVKKQQIWEENMLPGSVIQMRKESAYINEHLFIDWLENHFSPRKSEGPCLLILNGHASHINSPDMLQMAADKNIHILCLPSHTIHYLQPLDRAFFKPLKTYFRNACCEWANANPTKKIGRHHFGLLLSKAWSQAATTQTGISGFRATGIYPFCPTAIPEQAYLETQVSESSSSEDDSDIKIFATNNSPTIQTLSTHLTIDENVAQLDKLLNIQQSGPSSAGSSTKKCEQSLKRQLRPKQLLKEVSPIPKTDNVQAPRRKQSAMIVTTPSIISIKQEKRELKKSTVSLNKIIKIKSNDTNENDINTCIECYELYYDTLSKADWIQCISCKKWLHETCTMYINTCNMCKRIEFQQINQVEEKVKIKRVNQNKINDQKSVKNKKWSVVEKKLKVEEPVMEKKIKIEN